VRRKKTQGVESVTRKAVSKRSKIDPYNGKFAGLQAAITLPHTDILPVR
jgi:hypothetical protein